MFKIKNKVVSDQETSLFKGLLATELEEIPEITTPITFKGGKIDSVTWDSVVGFLCWAYKEYGGEAQIRLFYNSTTGKWTAHPFEQYVSKSLSTDEAKDSKKNTEIIESMIANGFTNLGTVHQHCNISAFMSGTDYKDEIVQNGIHMTLGYLSNPVLDFHARAVFRGVMYKPDVIEWFEVEPNLDNTAERPFPQEWKALVIEKPKPVVHVPSFSYGRHAWDEWEDNWKGWMDGKKKSEPVVVSSLDYWQDKLTRDDVEISTLTAHEEDVYYMLKFIKQGVDEILDNANSYGADKGLLYEVEALLEEFIFASARVNIALKTLGIPEANVERSLRNLAVEVFESNVTDDEYYYYNEDAIDSLGGLEDGISGEKD